MRTSATTKSTGVSHSLKKKQKTDTHNFNLEPNDYFWFSKIMVYKYRMLAKIYQAKLLYSKTVEFYFSECLCLWSAGVDNFSIKNEFVYF